MFDKLSKVSKPQYSNTQCTLDTREMRFCRDIVLDFGSVPVTLNSVVLSTVDIKDCAVIDIVASGNERVNLLLPREVLGYICNTLAGNDDAIAIQSLPIIFELAWQSFFEEIEAATGLEFAVKSVTFGPEAARKALRQASPRAVQVSIDSADIYGPVVFIASPDIQSLFDKYMQSAELLELPFPDHLSGFPLTAEVNITSTAVTLDFLNSMEIGDVVKLPCEDYEPDLSARLRVGNRLYGIGKIEKNSLFVVESVRQADPVVSSGELFSNAEELQSEQVFNLDVDFGVMELSASVLQNIAVGDAFELDGSFSEKILLKVEGKILARGELVSIGTAKGVRISKLYKKE